MAFLVRSPEISTVSARIFSDSNSNVNHAFMRRKVTVSAVDARNLSGVKNQKSRLYGKFSAPVKEDCEISREEEEDKQNYYVNMGHAVRCIREEFPSLFYKEPNFDIYRDDIVFRDPMNTFMGIDNYKSIFWALRFHGRIFFRALCVDIVSVWQPTENTLMIRWTVHGIPRGPWETRGRFDGTSEYKFDKNGKIYEHKVDNIAINSPPKFQMLTVQELVEAISCPSTPKPTYFEFGDSSSSSETY
ncbi:hypothetical protein EUTSA_v10001605mg [Eutrema salsugineum]|uniref:Uncharacterized protein n=1 Tax=Eutrema salsugineum TaxID=72664 RepID=V4L6I0_EUTSA|nr:uncharacterized protein LOC18015841 [Eutrema salsugineum]ESQ39259.1 hypothetical protein EUTSA_v10001605mg [Eutrema salsugineum]